MPSRVPVRLTAQCCRAALESLWSIRWTGRTGPRASASMLQTRNSSILANLSDNKGAHQKRIRLGRGASSGKGKTSGRGQKGQKARSTIRPWFQGGQTPLLFSKGRLGFENIRAERLSEVNLDKLQSWIDQGRIDPTKQITPKELIQTKLVGTIKDGIKILGRGGNVLKQPINIIVSRASASAIAEIEKAGGKIITRYYTKMSMKRLVEGKSVNTDLPLPRGAEHVAPMAENMKRTGFFYRLPDPTGRWDMEYYRDPAHRGYLSHQLQAGESPSLFFKVPPSVLQKHKKVKKAKTEDSKLW